jgi:predicted DsbA family dithiol-disulfide isomerase
MTRFLYAVVAVLVLVVAWKGWVTHQSYALLDRAAETQSYGATADTARVTIDAFVNYTHRDTKDISADVLEVISRESDTRIVFHPVSTRSLLAYKAAQIAVAAGLQGRFIAMHEELMRNEKPLIEVNIRDMAERAKVDADRLLQDMNSEAVVRTLEQDARIQKKLKIIGSPLFLVNREWLYGPNSVAAVPSDLVKLINKARGS